MSTTPKKPSKWAAEIAAWGQGATIQVATFNKPEWSDCGPPGHESMPSFEDAEDVQYRIKPEPAAPVYPETKATNREIYDAVPPAGGTPFSHMVDPKGWHNIRDMMNYAIRRAIDDGQVVVIEGVHPNLKIAAKDMENASLQWAIAGMEKALRAAGFKPVSGTIDWYKSDVVDAEFDPDFQEVKEHDLHRSLSQVKQQLAHAERVLKANGFQYDEGIGWSIDSDKMDHTLFGHRVGRAVADFLGKDREEVPHDVIAAIVLLERAK